jgi:hypothetical protein
LLLLGAEINSEIEAAAAKRLLAKEQSNFTTAAVSVTSAAGLSIPNSAD